MTKEVKSVNADSKPSGENRVKEKPSRDFSHKKEKVKPLTKIIIRHLPPTMTEEEFLKQIDPLPEHDFYYYAAPDWSLGYEATCRAYLNLKNYEDVFLFRDRFDGYVFVDSKGAEYPAIVEFAPFQGLIKNKSRKTDAKVNTIESEQHYQNFLAKLEEDREAAAKGGETKLEFSLDRKKDEKITSTPLLQYLANKKAKRREESKRRTDEKRRQRDDEKDRRQRNQMQVTKIMTGADSGAKDAAKLGSIQENAGDKGEEKKKARAQRRAERNQRRREEHEQKKRERDRPDKEQKDKVVGDESKTKSEQSGKFEPNKSVKLEADKPNEAKTEDANRKEVKKYSERRERDRNRNRKDKERPKDPIGSAEDKTNTKETPTESGEVSDVVKNFILSVATVKEFVPQHKQKEAEEQEANKTSGTQDGRDSALEVKEQFEKMSVNSADNTKSGDASEQKHGDNSNMDERQLQKQRLAEERRIRNKDRPSIAIYQPKARLRQSEESDSNPVKEARSNPNSDGENFKKDEQRIKKVSRYSERRSERRSKEKRKDGSAGEDNANEYKSELRKSKSHEDNNEIGEREQSKELTPETN